jgi:hypothetical protein
MPGWLDRLKHRQPKSTKRKPPSADEAKTIRISARSLPPEMLPPQFAESIGVAHNLDETKSEPRLGPTPSSDESKTVVMPRAASRTPLPSGETPLGPAGAADAPAHPADEAGESPTVVLKVAYQAQHFPSEEGGPAIPPPAAPASPPASVEGSEELQGHDLALAQARERLNKVQEKINKTAEEFAEGLVNRAQFQELFDHYQRERRTILAWIETASDVPNWRELAAEGRSMIIRRQHKARVLGYAICEQQSGLPLRSIGEFEVDPELVVPMLTAYRSATQEIFGGGMRSTEIEGGHWLCFVTGEFCLLMVLFSNEPARKDLEGLDELLRTFERMNRYVLRRQPVNPDELFLPYRFYIDTPK